MKRLPGVGNYNERTQRCNAPHAARYFNRV
jgi:hypothetical protein